MGGGTREVALIRNATLTDVAAMHAIERATFGDPWSEASFQASVGADHVEALVTLREGVLIGYAIAWVFAPEAEIANIAVAPAARRSGAGRALLDELLARLDAKGVRTIFLEVRAGNDAAKALYAARGFVATGRRRGYYQRPVEDAVIMRREVAAAEHPRARRVK